MMRIEWFLIGSQIESRILVKSFSMCFMKLTAVLSLLLEIKGSPKVPPNCKSNLTSRGICVLLRSTNQLSCNWLRWDLELKLWGEMCVQQALLDEKAKLSSIVIFGICRRCHVESVLLWSVIEWRELRKIMGLILDLISMSRLWIKTF